MESASSSKRKRNEDDTSDEEAKVGGDDEDQPRQLTKNQKTKEKFRLKRQAKRQEEGRLNEVELTAEEKEERQRQKKQRAIASKKKKKKQRAAASKKQKEPMVTKKYACMISVSHPPTMYRYLANNPHIKEACDECLNNRKCLKAKPLIVKHGLKIFGIHGLFGVAPKRGKGRSKGRTQQEIDAIKLFEFDQKFVEDELNEVWPDLLHNDSAKLVRKEMRKHCRYISFLTPDTYAECGVRVYKKYEFKGLLAHIGQRTIGLQVDSRVDGWTGISIGDLTNIILGYEPFQGAEMMIVLERMEDDYYLSEVRMALFADETPAPRTEPLIFDHRDAASRVSGFFSSSTRIYLML